MSIRNKLAFGGSGNVNGNPILVSVTALSDVSLRCIWTNGATNQDGTKIYSSTSQYGEYSLAATVVGSGTQVDLTGLNSYTTYYIKAIHYKGSKASEYSNIISAATNAPSVLIDGKTRTWYAGDEPSTITKDGSNIVSRWNDKLLSGRDLLQADASKQPLFIDNAIRFNGSDEFMQASFTQAQPRYVYLVIKQLAWGATRYIFDGALSSSNVLVQHTSTPKLAAYAGTFSSDSAELPLNKWGIVRVKFNGASSELIVDNNAKISGNFGAATSAGLCLGSAANGSFGFANFKIKEFISRANADDDATSAIIYDYLKRKYITQITSVGDSTVAVYTSYVSVSSLINSTDKYNISDISLAGDSIDGQKAKWIALTNYEKLSEYTFVQIGINDIASAWTMAQLISKYQSLITTIRATVGPSRKIYGCTMTPCKQWLIDTKGEANYLPFYEKWVNLNNAIRGFYDTNISEMDGFVDQHTALLNDGNDSLKIEYRVDQVHSNNAGRQIIANAWMSKVV